MCCRLLYSAAQLVSAHPAARLFVCVYTLLLHFLVIRLHTHLYHGRSFCRIVLVCALHPGSCCRLPVQYSRRHMGCNISVQVCALLSRASHHQTAAERLCAMQHHMVHEVRPATWSRVCIVLLMQVWRGALLVHWNTKCLACLVCDSRCCRECKSPPDRGRGSRPSLQVDAATHHVSDPIAGASLTHAATGSTAGSTTAAGSSSGALLRGGGRALRLLGL